MLQPTQYHIMKHRLSIKNKGLSLIEVLIVMALAGISLIALLNIVTRDLLIEQLNQSQDTADYIALSQFENFDYLWNLPGNSSCLQNLTATSYFICTAGSGAVGGLTQVAACDAGTGQTWLLYSDPGNKYINVSSSANGGYDCSATSTNYQEQMAITAVGSTSLTGDSLITYTTSNNDTHNISYEKQYYF